MMATIPKQYDVFHFIRTPPRTTGFIFLKAYGSGRFIDLNVEESSMQELAYKYIISRYLSSQSVLIIYNTASYLVYLFGGVPIK